MRVLLTPGEAAGRLGVSRQTLHRWEAAGTLTRIDPQGPPRYDAADVAALARRRAASRSPEQLKERLLEVAASVVAEHGAAAATIEAIATRAGVSRGAVVHHFPHKRELLRGLVAAFIARFESRWAKEAEAAGPGGLAAAYVRATSGPDDVLTAALLVCAGEEPALLEPLRVRVPQWYRRIGADAGNPAVLVPCLAADAMWLFRLFGIVPVDPGGAVGALVAAATRPGGGRSDGETGSGQR